jgi:outer membrane protein OmpA-like peptidoglycan-associated protein
MVKSLLVLVLLSVAANGWTQEQSAFLPQNLGQSINSTYDELNPVISPDGKTLYFVRANHWENTYGSFDSQDIWFSELQNGNWTPAKRISELNIGRYNAVLSVTHDGKTVLINGVYNKKGTFWKKRGLSTSSKLESGKWSTPVPLKIKKLKKINDGSTAGAFMNNNENVILLSLHRWYNSNKADIFVSTKSENGKWRKPKKVHLLSSGLTETSPYLTADNKTVYFSSDDAAKGQFDVYKATRGVEDWQDWDQPIKLSDTINSPGWESGLKTNLRGSVAYFASTNQSTGGSDIFKVKLFEENPFVIVSGNVINGKTNQPISREFAIQVDGRQADSVFVNTDSSTYRLKLPLGKKYEASASVQYFTSTGASIDASTIREFTTLKKDLVVTPLPYVKVTGKVLNRVSGQLVSASANVKILIDNLESDSLKFDPETSSYTLTINHGSQYKLQAKASKFESLPAVLDLTNVDEFREINFNLFLETEKMVTVKGLINDKKSGKPFSPASKVQVVFTGPTTITAPIDTLTSRYEIVLQPGSNYAITVSAPNCLPAYESIDLTTIARGSTLTKDLVLAPVEVGQAVRLNNIFFESGHSTLKKESFPELDKVFDFLDKNPSLKIEIGGHTDNVGNAAFNLTLSASRAKAVATYLTKKGIAADRLQSKGYGITKPVVSNATKEGKAQNRRVEFVILGK